MSLRVPNVLCSFLGLTPGTTLSKDKILHYVSARLSNTAESDDHELSDSDNDELRETKKSLSGDRKMVSLSDKKKWGLSPELCNFFGVSLDTRMTHQEALSRLVKYIKTSKNLLVPSDLTRFHMDERLRTILDPSLPCTYPALKQHLQKHYLDCDAPLILHATASDDSKETQFMDHYGRTITFLKPVVEKVRLSDALADLLEVPRGTIMGRDEASNRVISYIKFRELDQRPEGFFIRPDHALQAILEPKLPGVDHFSFINLQAHLVKHFTKVSEADVVAERERLKAIKETKKAQNRMQDLEDD